MADAPLYSAGQRIGRYEIVREVGYGGMAAVYAARLRSVGDLEKMFAIKVLLPHLRGDREFVAMFMDEARLAMRLDHPNIAQVYELGDDGGTPYLVMQYLRGQSLSALVRRGDERERRLGEELFLHVMAEVAEGLHAAHELEGPDGVPLDVVHRDVSPQNVHVGYDGRVRVVDFGIARARGRMSHTATGLIKGKFRYCSPEQVTRPTEVDRRTDIWALGVMTWELYARTPLFSADDQSATLWNVVNKTIPPLRSVAPHAPEAVDRLIARCLDRDVDARPKTAAEVARVLREAASGSKERLAAEIRGLFQHEILQADEVRVAAAPVAVVRAPDDSLSNAVTVETARPRRRYGALVAVALVSAVALGSAGIWYSLGGDEPIAREPVAPARASPARITASEEAEPPAEAPASPAASEPAEPELTERTHVSRRNRRNVRAPANSEGPSEMMVETLMPSPY